MCVCVCGGGGGGGGGGLDKYLYNYPFVLKSFIYRCSISSQNFYCLRTFHPPQVQFNEPLSMLQRMVEDYIYSDVLVQAAAAETTLEEMMYVAAFATSCYASSRMNKSFNPLLGETFECDRRAEQGWRCLMEQVRESVWRVRVCGCEWVEVPHGAGKGG